MAPISIVVAGAGNRGTGYARWALEHPDRARVVAVAEPRDVRRARFAAEHGIPAADTVASWKDLAARPRFADAVLICTQDQMHEAPAEAFAAAGYHILLEKPMAPDEAGCRRIVAAVERAGVMLAVGHVMRYTSYTRAVKEIVDSGELGDIMSVQHLEPVGFWHQAHSFVRGNWRRADLANTMLMAKSCHDLDWLAYILGRAPDRVSSFGHLTHFTAANRPVAAADRCVTCPVEASCAYSATRLYGGLLERGEHGWRRRDERKVLACVKADRHRDTGCDRHVPHRAAPFETAISGPPIIWVAATDALSTGYRPVVLDFGILGPLGYLPAASPGAVLHGDLERAARAAQVNTFGGGVNEVQRELIAMFGLGLPKVPR